MRIPQASVNILRRSATDNLPDLCVIKGRTIVELPGGVKRPGPWAAVDTQSCSIVPLDANNDIIAERETRAGLFVVSFELGTPVSKDQQLVVTSHEEGWTKTLDVTEVLDQYTNQVVTKAYCKEV